MTQVPEPGRVEAPPSFSDPQVNLYAGDVETALAFYRDVLGFRETFRFPREGTLDHAELRLGPLTMGIASYDALARHHSIVSGPGPARLEIALFTDDPDGAFAWATSHGAPTLISPHDFGGYLRSARVADPIGNPVVFTTPLPLKVVPNPGVRPEFRGHLVNLYCEEIDRSLAFYRDLLGFAETFRTPKQGPPEHVEMKLGALYLGVSTLEALRSHHGLSGGGGPPRAELVLWVNDADSAHAWATAKGVRSRSVPHDFAERLRSGWIEDPDGNPVQLVARKR